MHHLKQMDIKGSKNFSLTTGASLMAQTGKVGVNSHGACHSVDEEGGQTRDPVGCLVKLAVWGKVEVLQVDYSSNNKAATHQRNKASGKTKIIYALVSFHGQGDPP